MRGRHGPRNNIAAAAKSRLPAHRFHGWSTIRFVARYVTTHAGSHNEFLALAMDSLQQPGHVLSENFHGLDALRVALHFARLPADADVPIR